MPTSSSLIGAHVCVERRSPHSQLLVTLTGLHLHLHLHLNRLTEIRLGWTNEMQGEFSERWVGGSLLHTPGRVSESCLPVFSEHHHGWV